MARKKGSKKGLTNSAQIEESKKFHTDPYDSYRNSQLVDLIAKKDWVLFQNDYHRDIKEGDDVSDVPPKLLEALRTEGVV